MAGRVPTGLLPGAATGLGCGAMAAVTKDAGVPVTCPGCGETVLQKAMIPTLGDDGTGIRYLCVMCARKLVDTAPKNVAQTEEPV